MAEQPLVSIIIPTYNRAHLIGETLDSVLAQTYTNWECIVVDDGSTDATDELMAKYCAKDSRIRYYHRPDEHLPGGNGARNYGFKMSKGEYIQWFDSDDLMHVESLEIKVRNIIRSKVDVIISKTTTSINKLGTQYSNLRKEFDIVEKNDFYIDFIKSRNNILIGDPIIVRSKTIDVIFDEKLIRGQDHDYLIRLFSQSLKIGRIRNYLYYYRKSENSITRQAANLKFKFANTQILLNKKMLSKYSEIDEVAFEYHRKNRKLYRSYIEKNRPYFVFLHYNFFRKSFNLSIVEFSIYLFLNMIFKKGFDRMKYKI
ncbi:glycosyltransferase family 2 protein [Mesonia sediminis]|uniref:Glycosyltransferase family 2 protein n=1 Tax=Mesonia sediminis TaxID=1703946 RepID=A0ABW5SFZ9_9FLAO